MKSLSQIKSNFVSGQKHNLMLTLATWVPVFILILSWQFPYLQICNFGVTHADSEPRAFEFVGLFGQIVALVFFTFHGWFGMLAIFPWANALRKIRSGADSLGSSVWAGIFWLSSFSTTSVSTLYLIDSPKTICGYSTGFQIWSVAMLMPLVFHGLALFRRKNMN